MRQSSPEAIKTAGDLGVNIASIGRHIRAENVSPQTFIAYVGAARQFYRCLADVDQQVAHYDLAGWVAVTSLRARLPSDGRLHIK